MVKINKKSSQPYYLQIKEWLQEQVATGKLNADAPLPDERTLAKRLGTSRVTVRRAIAELTKAGYFDRVRGRGTFLRAGITARGSDAARTDRVLSFTVVTPFNQAEIRESFFYYRILEGLQEATGEAGIGLVYRKVAPGGDFAASLSRDGNVGGMVILGFVNQEILQALAQLPVPKILVDSTQPEGMPPCDSVEHEGEESSYRAVSHLLDLGHRAIGLMTFGPTPASKERRAGFERALAVRGIASAPERIYTVECNGTAAYAETRRILNENRMPSALFCTTDELALGAMAAARDHGLQVPRDLSIVGYGDLGYFCYPALSSVRIPLEAMGRKAAEILRARIASPQAAPQRILFPSEFVPRATSGVPNVSRT